MKVTYFTGLIAIIGLGLTTFQSCDKSAIPGDASVSTQDANNVSKALDATSDDAAAAAGQVSHYKSILLNNSGGSFLIGATITDTSSAGIVIQYDGVSLCTGMTRSGTIAITNTGGLPWHDAGAVLTVSYNNIIVTDIVSGYTYTLNGTHTITNVTGGLAWQVVASQAPSTTVTHRIQSSGMSITFPNGAQKTWTVDRTRSWSSTADNSTITITESSSPNSADVTETGEDRYGTLFTNSITSAIIGNNNCDWRPYTGTYTHQMPGQVTSLQYGTDTYGNQVGTPAHCGSYGDYGFNITYINASLRIYRFVSYWR